MLSEISFIVDPILYFLLIKQSDLSWSDALNPCNVMRVVMFIFIIHVADLIVVNFLLISHSAVTYLIYIRTSKFKNSKSNI